MRWLIVEDALQDRKGHWYEYVRTFRDGLLALGDSVEILVSRKADGFIVDTLGAKPLLPESIWHRMSDGAPAWRRQLRVPLHAWRTYSCLNRWLKDHRHYDVIFVPTVSVHHLLGWHWLTRKLDPKWSTRVLLYFLSLPLRQSPDGQAQWVEGSTSRLLQRLFGKMPRAVKAGRLILGVETEPLKVALETLTGLPVQYLAQPVQPFAAAAGSAPKDLLMGCYGGARCEKGSELLQSAIAKYLDKCPQTRARFAVQWIDDFQNEQGDWVRLDPKLVQDTRVTFIRNYFVATDYAGWLAKTKVMLLPYQRASYRLRGSRVAIEAMIHGIPAVVTRGTSMAQQLEQFGAAILCEDGSVDSLVQAMFNAEQNIDALRRRAEEQKSAASSYFSVAEFRQNLLACPASPV